MCTTTHGPEGVRTDEFCRLQLAIDALLDFQADEFQDGPTGPDDEYLAYARAWWTYIASGHALTNSRMAASLAADVEPTLTLEDCIDGLTTILRHLESLEPTEFHRHRDGILRANRGNRRANAGRRSNDGPSDAVPITHYNAAYALRFQEVWGAINALRDTTPPFEGRYRLGDVVVGTEDFGTHWAALWNSAMIHVAGGDAGYALSREIRRAPIAAEDCMAGLHKVLTDLEAMTPWERSVVFASMFHAYN